MANTQAVCNTFRRDLLNGLHAFGTTVIRAGTTKDSFKMALYLTTATVNASSTAYTATGELAATGNYTATGAAVTNGTDPAITGGTGIVAWWNPTASVSWAALTSSGAFDACMLYNDTSAGKNAVAVFTFGSQTVTGGTFTLTMPAAAYNTALIMLG